MNLTAVQSEVFVDQLSVLQDSVGERLSRDKARKRNVVLKQRDTLYRLDPYVDTDGVLRVGGRIRIANVPRDIAHPVILPRKHQSLS